MNQSLIRSILKIGAGFFVAKGYTDESNAEIIIAGLVALASVIWGVLQRSGAKNVTPVPLIALFACFACFAGTASAVQPSTPAPVPSALDTIIIPDQLFRAGEVQLDFFGTGHIEDLSNLSENAKGAGVGLNYFPWRAAGFGLEARGEGIDGLLVDATAVSLIGRFPIEKLRLAPEIKIGTDYGWEGRDWAVFAALGLDYRLTRHLALGAELRGVRPIEGAEGEHVLALLKCRIVF